MAATAAASAAATAAVATAAARAAVTASAAATAGWAEATLAVPYIFALVTGEQIAYQIALVCLVGRITGDILQNILDGCYWKCGLFLGFEGPALIMLYTQAM